MAAAGLGRGSYHLAMPPDPRLAPLDLLQAVPRAWIEAVPASHSLLVDAIVDRSPGDLLIRGRPGDDAVALSSLTGVVPDRSFDDANDAVAAIRDRLGDGERWLIVRDPQLMDDTSLGVVQATARSGNTPIVVVTPPGTVGIGLRDLLADTGIVHLDGPIDDSQLQKLIAGVADLDDEEVTTVAARTGGRRHLLAPLLAAAAAADLEAPGTGGAVLLKTPQPVVDAVRAITGRLGPETLQPLAALAVARVAARADATSLLQAEGLVDDDGAAYPIVADALVATLTEAARRTLADLVVGLHVDGALDALPAMEAIERVGVVPDRALPLVVAAAGAVMSARPWQALGWIEMLSDTARRDPAARSIHIRSLALVGRMTDALALADTGSGVDSRLVTAAGLAHAARFEASATAYDEADPDNTTGIGAPVLGTPPRVLIGTLPDEVTDRGSTGVTGHAARGFAGSTRRLLFDTAGGVADLGEAAALAASADLTLWPDTPHGIGAMVHSLRLEHEAAGHLISVALVNDVGGAPFRNRHRAVAGWVALRAGRWKEARDLADEVMEEPLALRDRLLSAALDVALLRRANDAAALGPAVDAVTALVRQHPPDLLSLVAHLEMAVAAVRVHGLGRASGLLDQLDELVAGAPDDPWRTTVALYRGVAAVVGSDDAALTSLPAADDGIVGRFLATARALGDGEVDVDELATLADDMVEVGLVHEASVIVSLSALRSSDEADAKRLLNVARGIRARLPGRGADESTGFGALSEREVEVANELIAGHTYKEIGSRLFISAKTVEHHIAHIKTKLGATSRAEMLAALRSALQ